ncbi:MAG: hypothetical protein OXR66_03200 [Candidatus Woesearchaeota archaeon]|nr:hypothetical protein [Candidatus Woesearchaeota archaeon]
MTDSLKLHVALAALLKLFGEPKSALEDTVHQTVTGADRPPTVELSVKTGPIKDNISKSSLAYVRDAAIYERLVDIPGCLLASTSVRDVSPFMKWSAQLSEGDRVTIRCVKPRGEYALWMEHGDQITYGREVIGRVPRKGSPKSAFHATLLKIKPPSYIF